MNIQKAAEASGLTPDTIRFYERKQIVPAPGRRANGYRRYTHEHVVMLRLARGLRQLGVPLSEIAPIVRVAHDGRCFEVRETLTWTLREALAETERRVRDLAQLRDHMAEMLSGLGAMAEDSANVPGIEPCQCVRIVSDG